MILPYYAKFLVDNEYELKNIAAKNIRVIVKYLESDDIINKIVPIIKSIVSDEHAYVRGNILKNFNNSKSFFGIILAIARSGFREKSYKWAYIRIFFDFIEGR